MTPERYSKLKHFFIDGRDNRYCAEGLDCLDEITRLKSIGEVTPQIKVLEKALGTSKFYCESCSEVGPCGNVCAGYENYQKAIESLPAMGRRNYDL